jgi:hypothetical protein
MRPTGRVKMKESSPALPTCERGVSVYVGSQPYSRCVLIHGQLVQRLAHRWELGDAVSKRGHPGGERRNRPGAKHAGLQAAQHSLKSPESAELQLEQSHRLTATVLLTGCQGMAA